MSVRRVFEVSEGNKIYGCFVESGIINNTSSVFIVREGVYVGRAYVQSLRRFVEDVPSVKERFECGVVLKGSHVVQGDELWVLP